MQAERPQVDQWVLTLAQDCLMLAAHSSTGGFGEGSVIRRARFEFRLGVVLPSFRYSGALPFLALR